MNFKQYATIYELETIIAVSQCNNKIQNFHATIVSLSTFKQATWFGLLYFHSKNANSNIEFSYFPDIDSNNYLYIRLHSNPGKKDEGDEII